MTDKEIIKRQAQYILDQDKLIGRLKDKIEEFENEVAQLHLDNVVLDENGEQVL